MAIETQFNYTTGENQFSWMNNFDNGGIKQFRQPLDQRTLFCEQYSVLMERQKQDIDRFINLQYEKMRFILQEQSKQQMEEILKTIEARGRRLIQQKDHEIAKVSKKTMELETLLQKIEIEKLTWQQAVKNSESMSEYLKNMLEQAMVDNNNACRFGENMEDAASCCGGRDDSENTANGMVCRSCGSRPACVLFLPCRHLSSCRDCEAVLDSCPGCNAPKKFTIEALIFQEGR